VATEPQISDPHPSDATVAAAEVGEPAAAEEEFIGSWAGYFVNPLSQKCACWVAAQWSDLDPESPEFLEKVLALVEATDPSRSRPRVAGQPYTPDDAQDDYEQAVHALPAAAREMAARPRSQRGRPLRFAPQRSRRRARGARARRATRPRRKARAPGSSGSDDPAPPARPALRALARPRRGER
jgi:hypothetical protein